MSKEMLVIVDETKLTPHLGGKKCPLPVEILPFAFKATVRHLEQLGLRGMLREKENGKYFVTDNGNFIFDIFFDNPIPSPEHLEKNLHEIPGVVETGLFIQMAGRVIVDLLKERSRSSTKTPPHFN